MAQHTLVINTTVRQEDKLTRILASVNAQRAQQLLPPFATLEDYFLFVLSDAVKSWVQQQSNLDAQQVGNLYDAATDQVKAQINQLLGL